MKKTINFGLTKEQLDKLCSLKNQDWHLNDMLMVVMQNQGILEDKLDKLLKIK